MHIRSSLIVHTGALGSKYYSCYDVDNAMSITKSGQTAIKEMLRYVNEKLKSFADTNIINFVVAGDTDSIFKDSLISVDNLYKIYFNNKVIKLVGKNEKLKILRSGKEHFCNIDTLQKYDQMWCNMFIPVKNLQIERVDKIEIEELYKLLSNDESTSIDILENGTEVLLLNDKNIKCDSINGLTNIKNISRHKVTKDKWKVSVGDKTIYTTCDHSVMVYRNGTILEVRPEDIKESDCLIVKKDSKE